MTVTVDSLLGILADQPSFYVHQSGSFTRTGRYWRVSQQWHPQKAGVVPICYWVVTCEGEAMLEAPENGQFSWRFPSVRAALDCLDQKFQAMSDYAKAKGGAS